MQTHAPPGAIQVTERTYRRLKEGFALEQRTEVVVKGKGEMRTYILLGERPSPRSPGRATSRPAPDNERTHRGASWRALRRKAASKRRKNQAPPFYGRTAWT